MGAYENYACVGVFCVVQSETLGLCILPSFLGDSSDARHSEGITAVMGHCFLTRVLIPY